MVAPAVAPAGGSRAARPQRAAPRRSCCSYAAQAVRSRAVSTLRPTPRPPTAQCSSRAPARPSRPSAASGRRRRTRRPRRLLRRSGLAVAGLMAASTVTTTRQCLARGWATTRGTACSRSRRLTSPPSMRRRRRRWTPSTACPLSRRARASLAAAERRASPQGPTTAPRAQLRVRRVLWAQRLASVCPGRRSLCSRSTPASPEPPVSPSCGPSSGPRRTGVRRPAAAKTTTTVIVAVPHRRSPAATSAGRCF